MAGIETCTPPPLIAETPRLERKWTRRNDEWVQVLFAIHQGPGGRYDTPVELPTYAKEKKP